jgi:signal transduction histidine kinase
MLPVVYWALATLPVVVLARHFPVGRGNLLVAIPVHLAAGLMCAAGDVAVDMFAARLVGEPMARPFLENFVNGVHTNLLLYGAIVAVYEVARYERLSRDRELRAVQLETQLVRAQLNVLRMQIQPHFLFNTMNAISQLFHEDADAAERMMARLGDLLRMTLEQSGEHEVALAHELEFLNRYVDIQKARFQEQLEVQVDVPAELLAARVPSLLLQPLVENAIKHGVARSDGKGLVAIRVHRQNDHLVLEVRDNGPGLPAKVTRNVGLTNTDERIRQLYGEGGVTLLSAQPTGTIARVVIPLRQANETTAEEAS